MVGSVNSFDHAVLRGQMSNYMYIDGELVDTSSWNTYPSFEPAWSFKSLTAYLPARQANKNNNLILGYSIVSKIWVENNPWQKHCGFKAWLHNLCDEDYILNKHVPSMIWGGMYGGKV